MIAGDDIWTDLEAGAEPLSLREARRLPMLRVDGRSPDLSTLFRWSDPGSAPRGPDGERIVLGTAKIGGTRCTTRQAVLRFLRRLTPEAMIARAPRSTRRRDRDVKRALDELEREGF